MKTKRPSRLLAMLLTLVMLAGLLPMAALADGDEDQEAALNEMLDQMAEDFNQMLGKDVFRSGTAAMTEGDAAAILIAAGYDSGEYKEGSSTRLTRAEACEVLAVLYQLPIGEKSAIQYLADEGIISGTAEGNLDEGGAIRQGEFALIAVDRLGDIPTPPDKGDDNTTTPGEGEDGKTPGEGEEGTTPGEGEEGTTPGEGEEGTTPGEGEEGTTPGEGEGGSTDFDNQASAWAREELKKAEALGLIPDCLEGQDLTQDITRAEFAAVVVKVYEALSGTAAIPAVNNPFTDCTDVEVLKAYNIGAVNGTSDTTYEPDSLLNREEASTMLTRVFKKVALVGWTLADDSQFTLEYEKPAAFADDADISAWAKDSVYFMAANGIMNGVGDNMFAPKNVTTAQEAEGYANTTREQALLIAVRMVENLGE